MHVDEGGEQILQTHAGSQASYGEQHGAIVRPSEEGTCFRPTRLRRKAIEIDGAGNDTDYFLWNSILPVQQLRESFGKNDGSRCDGVDSSFDPAHDVRGRSGSSFDARLHGPWAVKVHDERPAPDVAEGGEGVEAKWEAITSGLCCSISFGIFRRAPSRRVMVREFSGAKE